MSEQDREREQVDEAQEDMELPDERSEDVKGGQAKKSGDLSAARPEDKV